MPNCFQLIFFFKESKNTVHLFKVKTPSFIHLFVTLPTTYEVNNVIGFCKQTVSLRFNKQQKNYKDLLTNLSESV